MLNLIEIESENWNFLKYGRIGEHPMQSLYQGTTIPCDILHLYMYIGSTSVLYILKGERGTAQYAYHSSPFLILIKTAAYNYYTMS